MPNPPDERSLGELLDNLTSEILSMPEDYQVIERDPPTLRDIHDRAYHEARGCKYIDVTSLQDRKGTRRWIRKEPPKDLE